MFISKFVWTFATPSCGKKSVLHKSVAMPKFSFSWYVFNIIQRYVIIINSRIISNFLVSLQTYDGDVFTGTMKNFKM